MADQHDLSAADLKLKADIIKFIHGGSNLGGRVKYPQLGLSFSGKDVRKAVVGYCLLMSGKAR